MKKKEIDLMNESKSVPAWIYEVIREICEGKNVLKNTLIMKLGFVMNPSLIFIIGLIELLSIQ